METGMLRQTPLGIDAARLTRWLDAHLPEHGPLRGVGLLAGGRSNLTYRLDWGDRTLVLRRPPLGHVLATAHDMEREHRVLSALAGTGVPVPRTFGLCRDPEVTGAPFYLMELVEGTVYRRDADLAGLGSTAAHQVAGALVDALAGLHTVDPGQIGLDGLGRPHGFMERQVRRWRRQWEDSAVRAVPGADSLNDRLAVSCPPQAGVSLVHGDYKLDNVFFAAGDPGRVAAVLDWEMSTLGDPLSDLGMLCMYWDAFAGLDGSPVATPGALPGWPGRDWLVRRYARQSTAALDRLDWYVAFAYYKLAVIVEGIVRRTAQGLTVGEESADLAQAVSVLVERGHAALDRDC